VRPTPDEPFAALEQVAARQSAEERAGRALAATRARLVLGRDAKSVFFATLLLRLRPETAWDLDTIATDGRVLRYHPPFVTGLSPDELAGVLVHEVMHCALTHPVRRGNRNAENWNVACDLAINPLLLQAGFVLPAGRLLPGEGRYAGLPPGKSAEEYYAGLPDPSGSHQQEADAGSMPTDPGGCGQVVDPKHGDPAAARQVESEWQVAVAEAQQTAATWGPLPSGIGRSVARVLSPSADWRRLLRDFVSLQARNDYSWLRPNRRLLAHGLYLPGLQSEELGDVILAVDTSGSIDDQTLGLFASETNGVLAAFECTLTILYHDSRVQAVQKWRSSEGPLVLQPIGGGGTSHACVFEWIDQSGLEPACVICLTDLETEFPATVPSMPVLWAVAGAAGAHPPFGQVVALST
jgi:predicted metal-dependent peptidase